MRVLLDTHILLWCLDGSGRLPREAASYIENADEVYASVVNLWEMAIKRSMGKLSLDLAFSELPKIITDSGFSLLAFQALHAIQVAELPPYHRDPFDRILVAQSLSEPLRLLTHDRELEQYGSTVLVL